MILLAILAIGYWLGGITGALALGLVALVGAVLLDSAREE
jgi:hypothetical protein